MQGGEGPRNAQSPDYSEIASSWRASGPDAQPLSVPLFGQRPESGREAPSTPRTTSSPTQARGWRR